ncbi:MAG: type IX secretion system plug protein domain-containing protein [Bacteroidota bacterium]
MRTVVLTILVGWTTLTAQEILSDRIVGMRMSGTTKAEIPVAGMGGDPITVEFDLKGEVPENVRLRVIHCDRDWKPTGTSFINNETANRARVPILYEFAPAGVRGYRFQYRFKLPGIAGIDQFAQSGNYLFELLDEEWSQVLARGRFYVVENLVRPVMKIANRQLASGVHPWNKVHRVEVGVVIPDADADGERRLLVPYLTRVDIIKNRQLYHPWRIDAGVFSSTTFVEGIGTSRLKFVIENVQPGSEYRRIDLRNVTDYPEGVQLRPRSGADVSRYLQSAPRDNNGVSLLTTGSRFAEYVPFQFELILDPPPGDSVMVVGDFNGWRPSAGYRLRYDEGTNRFRTLVLLKRGLHDYQYTLGNHDWVSLEGNDWRTVNVYSAFVYYLEPRYGGFDRIVGFVQGTGPGGSGPTSP